MKEESERRKTPLGALANRRKTLESTGLRDYQLYRKARTATLFHVLEILLSRKILKEDYRRLYKFFWLRTEEAVGYFLKKLLILWLFKRSVETGV